MIGTDKYSYQSRLKTVDPTAKIVLTASSMVLCLGTNGIAVSIFTIVFFCAVSALWGGTAVNTFLRLMRAPLFFLLVGTVTVIFSRFPNWDGVLIGVQIGDWIYGLSIASLFRGVRLVARAMGCVASVYFTVLSTPITDLMLAFRRMHLPQLFLSLMELIYRFIFLLYETAQRIHTAQASRLGYNGLKRSYESLGTLISMVFMKAYRKSDKIYTSLEARGYTGELCTLAPLYESGRRMYWACAGLTAVQLALFLIERGVVPF